VLSVPLDTAKIRMQTAARKVGGISANGLIYTVKDIINNEGFVSMYRGFSPAVMRAAFNAGSSIFMYKPILKYVSEWGETKERKKPVRSLQAKIFASLTAGALSQIIVSPVDVLKVHLQAQRNVDRQSLHKVAMDLFREKGPRFFWIGLRPSMLRSALGVCATLATYDHAKQYMLVEKRWFKEEGVDLHFACSAISGLAATLVTGPADVVKTRMIVNTAEKRTTLGWMKFIVQNEGVTALFRGIVPTYIRLCPWQMIFFISYEEISYRLFGTHF
jgi:hypothetical protein